MFVLIYLPLPDPLSVFLIVFCFGFGLVFGIVFGFFGRVQALRSLKNAENSGSC